MNELINKIQINTLPARNSTVGLWRFRDSLIDEINSLELNPIGTGNLLFHPGYTENDNTCIETRADVNLSLPAVEATEFDFGNNDFTIESIFRVIGSIDSEVIVAKKASSWDTPVKGFWVSIDSGGKVRAVLGDGTDRIVGISTTTVNDGKWHYIAVVFSRTNNQILFYIDGAADASNPVNISSVTGSISEDTEDLEIGKQLPAYIDEICISSELLTPFVITDRHTGKMEDLNYSDDKFYIDFLPNADRDNNNLLEFLKPFDRQYLMLRHYANSLNRIVFWDMIPDYLISHIASNYNFELIDPPYATARERRHFLPWIVWIYRRKGTIASIEKIIELTGFSVVFNELFSLDMPMILNKNRLYGRDLVVGENFTDGFSDNLSKWNSPLSKLSWWRLDSDRLLGTGDDTNSNSNCILFDDALIDFYAQTDFEIIDTASLTTWEFGLVLKYIDDNNWLRLDVRRAASTYIFVLVVNVAGVPDSTPGRAINLSDISPGEHKLWIHADFENDLYTYGLDDKTIDYEVSLDSSGVAEGQKGLFVNRDITLAFNSIDVQQLNIHEVAKLYESTFEDSKLQITLSGTPDYESERREYLKRVIPNYIPDGIEIEWL